MSDCLFRVWMSTKAKVGAHTAAQLLDHFGDPTHIYAAQREELQQCSFLRPEQRQALCEKSLDEAERILYRCEREHITILTPDDRAFPSWLKHINAPPLVLYVRGRLPDLQLAPAITIIGTRRCTPYGLAQAQKFGAALAEAGFTVVTGMAQGIDSAASRGALRAGKPTVAVLAGGVDICYPPENQRLMNDILLDGAVISENPPGTDSRGYRFPIRNRLMSGMSIATLVIEAPKGSGALITARAALEQGREVFVLPANVDNPSAVGSNRLLRDGEAGIVLEPMDIVRGVSGLLRTMPDEQRVRAAYQRAGNLDKATTERAAVPRSQSDQIEQTKPPEVQRPKKASSRPAAHTPTIEELEARPKPQLEDVTGDERTVADAIRKGASTPDEIVAMTGLDSRRALTALTMLEMDGLVKGSSEAVWLV